MAEGPKFQVGDRVRYVGIVPSYSGRTGTIERAPKTSGNKSYAVRFDDETKVGPQAIPEDWLVLVAKGK